MVDSSDIPPKDVAAAAGALLVVLSLCMAWYYLWVKPNDERMLSIRDCMYSEKIQAYHYRGVGVVPDLDERRLYAWCSEKVGR